MDSIEFYRQEALEKLSNAKQDLSARALSVGKRFQAMQYVHQYEDVLAVALAAKAKVQKEGATQAADYVVLVEALTCRMAALLAQIRGYDKAVESAEREFLLLWGGLPANVQGFARQVFPEIAIAA